MKPLTQPSSTTCGQTCLAILLDTEIERATELIGHDGITTEDEMNAAYRKATGHWLHFHSGKPTPEMTAIQLHKDPSSERKHWTVYNKGETLDPARIQRGLWPVWKFAEVSRG